MHVLRPNFKVGNLFFQILSKFYYDNVVGLILLCRILKCYHEIYFHRITYGVHYEVVSLSSCKLLL